MRIVFIISSRFGHTKKIAKYIAHKIAIMTIGNDNVVDYLDLAQICYPQHDLESYDLIIVGSSVRYGHFHKNLYRFSYQYSKLLNSKLTAFYSVSLLARKSDKCQPENNIYTRKFLAKTIWKPNVVSVFAGSLDYSHYNFFDKYMIYLIMKMTGGYTTMDTNIEYTNWCQVDQFTKNILNIT